MAYNTSITSYVDIRGAAEGTIFLSCGQEIAKQLLRKILPDDPLPGDEHLSMLEEALNETLNIIVGNCTQALSMTGLPISVFPPNSVHENESVVKVVLVNRVVFGERISGWPGDIQLLFAPSVTKTPGATGLGS